MSNMDSPSQALGIDVSAAAQTYGYMAWASADPEVAQILEQAAIAASTGVGWSQAQMDAALGKTDWWQKHSDSERTFNEQMANNPGTVNAQIAQKAADINQQLITQGVEVDPSRLRNFAMDAVRFGWDDVELKAALASELRYQPSILLSKVGTNYKALVRQYAGNLSDDQIQQWAADSISGVKSDEEFRQFLVLNAKSLFRNNADMSAALDRGETVDQFASMYQNDAASLLGVNPDTINWSDPKWMAALNAQQVDAKGNPTGLVGPMDRNQWIAKLKTDATYGYWKTPNGQNEGAQTAQQLAQTFGVAFGVNT